jgi:hypothetical protein
MHIHEELRPYLHGTRFSNGLDVGISGREQAIPDRFSLLEERARGKRVIHVGCVDHLPLVEQKIREGRWLHARLCAQAERCLGVDINAEGIAWMRDHLGYDDVVCADITQPGAEAITGAPWDLLVMGEIVEHLDDPVGFLRALRENYAQHVDRIVITVPNAFAWDNFRNTLRHRECINTDHRYWFTPYTLAMVLQRAGIQADRWEFCEPGPVYGGGWKSRLRRRASLPHLLRERYPALRSTLVMEAPLR